MPWFTQSAPEISRAEVIKLMDRALDEARKRICKDPKRVLLLPPDITRMHSGSGWITEAFYNLLAPTADVHVIPTLGQHEPHTREQNAQMFGKIPHERIHPHDWRGGCVQIGEVPADYVKEKTAGAADWAFPLWLNSMLMKEKWDLIINIGHVVPHEVLGFANHNKNYFIGLAGKDLICTSHMAARQAREQNITAIDETLQKVVCVMQGDEFFSTWVANKAVYRTRMALADGGELLILAPGLKRFGEQPDVDALIRKYGYCGTPKVMELYKKNADMQDLAHASAHLIHGSSEGRFKITYAPGHLEKADIEQVKFGYANLEEMLLKYPIGQLKEGFNDVNGERIYFIPTPSAGLWATKDRLFNRKTGFGAG
jgi:nickel-dependent lactate racemase